MSDELIERLKERACPAGLSHTADEPWSDHGHTDCWLHWQAADALAAAETRIQADARSIMGLGSALKAAEARIEELEGVLDAVTNGVVIDSPPRITRTVTAHIRQENTASGAPRSLP